MKEGGCGCGCALQTKSNHKDPLIETFKKSLNKTTPSAKPLTIKKTKPIPIPKRKKQTKY